MDGNGIAAEGVQDQHVVARVGGEFSQLQSSISQDDSLFARAALGEKREMIPRQLHYGRVDLKKVVGIRWSSVGGNRADSQADHRNPQTRLPRHGVRERLSHAAVRSVVGRG